MYFVRRISCIFLSVADTAAKVLFVLPANSCFVDVFVTEKYSYNLYLKHWLSNVSVWIRKVCQICFKIVVLNVEQK